MNKVFVGVLPFIVKPGTLYIPIKDICNLPILKSIERNGNNGQLDCRSEILCISNNSDSSATFMIVSGHYAGLVTTLPPNQLSSIMPIREAIE